MRGRSFGAALLVLLLVGGALRAAVLAASFPPRPNGDELYYVGTAVNLAEGHGHLFNSRQRAFRPPAWSALLAPLVDVELRQTRLDPGELLPRLDRLDPAAPDPELRRFLGPLLMLPLALGALLVPVSALLGRALFDARSGLAAGAIVAFQPTLVAFSHYLLSETLFALLVTGGLALAVACRDRARDARPLAPALAAGAGLALGVAGLTRELGLGVALLCALWLPIASPGSGRRRALWAAALLLAAAFLVVLPWSWRNHQLFGRWVPVSTVGAFAAAEGNTFESPDWLEGAGPRRRDFKIRFFQIDGEMERWDFARAYTREQIAAEQPHWLPRKLVKSMGLLWTPDSLLLDRLRRGLYGEISGLLLRPLLVLHLLLYALLLGGGVWGLAACAGSRRDALGVWVLAAVCAVHVLANATPRFRVPWLPLLGVYAGYALLNARTLWASPARRLLWAPAAALLFVGWSAIPYFAEGARELWLGTAVASAAGGSE